MAVEQRRLSLHGLSLTAQAVAEQVRGTVVGRSDLELTGFAGLDDAGPNDLAFIASAKWSSRWRESAAGAALVSAGVDVADHDPETRALIVVDDAELALMTLLESVEPLVRPRPSPGIDASALVADGVDLGEQVHVGAGAVIQAGAGVGDESVIEAGAVVGTHARVGCSARMHPGSVLSSQCTLGDRSVLHGGAVVGAEGFGFRPDPDTGLPRRVVHLGHVVIGDDVEIGANSCVDRAKFGATRIGDGSKLDNLVQIGHNVVLGRCVIIAGQAGLAGSVTVGDGAVIGAQVGVAEHVTIGAGARIAATSGVMRDVPEGADYAGTPARPARETLREVTALRKLPDMLASWPKRRG